MDRLYNWLRSFLRNKRLINIVGDTAIIAFEVYVQHDNHNNATKFEVSVLKAKEALWEMQRKFCQTIRAIDTSFDDKEWDEKWLT